ncbi:hypothetical protein PF005_g1044 [Phytophthora fragariae]|uniref:RxLR effector protein n=1 Tax=Phytophthora fragariae TaxID=53985 RepID=A0A6A3FYS2_9STRA|nr:hypothetical protein PF003_g13411 [Phytophthora fragariae]KAE8949370.1 hypothetical protein PF009_g1114 [Phytophthora fragariae]KAE9030359.1 hypothetical protein PF011_g628 [Phytophthora fragariae]KAE9138637.1 hypothetical protein PF010_g868 [Phytophthora fragariae]KAE9139651.1 hypothetical protein PF007_g963 [Phytophthora fragariae]
MFDVLWLLVGLPGILLLAGGATRRVATGEKCSLRGSDGKGDVNSCGCTRRDVA